MRAKGISAVVTAIMVAVSGCQATTANPDRTATWASAKNRALTKSIQNYSIWPEFESQVGEAATEMGERLVELCRARPDTESLQECFHRQMLAAFDVHGAVGARCPLDEDTDADFQCIALSSYSYGMAKRAGGKALAEFDWSDLETSAVAASVQITTEQVRQCLSSGSASNPMDCAMAGVGKKLGLTKEDLKPCDAIEGDYKLGECIGQAYGFKELAAALARMRQLQV